MDHDKVLYKSKMNSVKPKVCCANIYILNQNKKEIISYANKLGIKSNVLFSDYELLFLIVDNWLDFIR